MIPKAPGARCEECPLRRNKIVPPSRTNTPRAIIVGESPGSIELEQGAPFVGPSGRLVWRTLKKIDRSTAHVTNAILCDPTGASGSELGKARRACLPRLKLEIDPLDADVLALGSTALHSAADLKKRPAIIDWHGLVVDSDPRRLVIPTVHPAFVLREESWGPVFTIDVERFERLSTQEWIRPEHRSGHRRLPTPKTIAELKASLAAFDETISFDIETTGNKATECKLVCVGMSDGRRTLVIPWATKPDGRIPWFNGRSDEAAQVVTGFLRSRTAVTHNGPNFDQITAERYGIFVHKWEDTLIAHHAIAGHLPKRLGHVVSVYEDAPAWKQEHKQAEASLDEICGYNAQDDLYTINTWHGMQNDLREVQFSYEFAKQSALLCKEMQINGFAFDRGRSREVRLKLRNREDELRRSMRRLIRDQSFDPLSTLQIRRAFFDKIKAPILYRSAKTDAPALNKQVLRAYSAFVDPIGPMASALLDFRAVRKARSTYIDGIEIDDDGRVHPNWLSYGTIGDRLSCQRPNLANLPKRNAVENIRQLYIAPRGRMLVGFDFAQIEMRVAAYWSGDPAMIAACESSDLHAANARILFPDFDTLNKEQKSIRRSIAKNAGFAVCYMASAKTVHERIVAEGFPLDLTTVERMLGYLRKSFRVYYHRQEDALATIAQTGYVIAPITGRRRWLGHNPKPTEAANFPIQSGAAAIALGRIFEICKRRPKSAKAVAQVYDQIIFECDRADAQGLLELCKEIAETPVELGGRMVRFPVDLQEGERWSDL